MRILIKTTKILIKLIVLMLIGLGLLIAAAYAYMQVGLPNAEKLKDARLQVPLRIFTQDKQLMAEFGDKRRIPVRYDEIPQPLINALLATEDKNFFQNSGVDFIGLARAVVVLATTGHKSQGGSTITMQVARNFFLSSKKTYLRKFNEILLAIKIDHALSKQEILRLYCNKIFLGKRAYGFAAAAQIYYGKTLDQLNLAQYAMLAGLPKAPSAANPINNPSKALQRRTHVLARMLELGYITAEQYQQAKQAPVTARYHPQKISVTAPYVAELIRQKLHHKYGDAIYSAGLDVYTSIDSKAQANANQAVLEALLAYTRRHGYHRPSQNLGEFSPNQINPSDQLDQSNQAQEQEQLASWQAILANIEIVDQLQAAAVLTVSDHDATALLADGQIIQIPWQHIAWAQPILANGKLGKIPETPSEVLQSGDVIRVYHDLNKQDWWLAQIPTVEGALIAANPNNGAILAMVGGLNFQQSHFNRTTQAKRQVGSALKPFIYAAALDKGLTLATIINDSPIVLADTGENALWRPQNDTKQFYGPTRLRQGLVESMNLLSIRLLQQIGIDYTVDYLQHFGFTSKQLPHSLSLAIGTADVTPLQLATSYSVFANGGYLVTPYIINTIYHTQNNKILYQHQNERVCSTDEMQLDDVLETYRCIPRVIDPQIAYLTNSAMQDVMKYGTAKKTRQLKRNDIAGKTGTSDDQNDAWFAGYNQNLVAITWVGFDDPSSTHEYGAQAALPMWMNFMRPMLAGTAETSLAQPPGIVTVRINPKTGQRIHPGQSPYIFEQFRTEHIPDYEDASNTTNSNGSSNSNSDSNNHNNKINKTDNTFDSKSTESSLSSNLNSAAMIDLNDLY